MPRNIVLQTASEIADLFDKRDGTSMVGGGRRAAPMYGGASLNLYGSGLIGGAVINGGRSIKMDRHVIAKENLKLKLDEAVNAYYKANRLPEEKKGDTFARFGTTPGYYKLEMLNQMHQSGAIDGSLFMEVGVPIQRGIALYAKYGAEAQAKSQSPEAQARADATRAMNKQLGYRQAKPRKQRALPLAPQPMIQPVYQNVEYGLDGYPLIPLGNGRRRGMYGSARILG